MTIVFFFNIFFFTELVFFSNMFYLYILSWCYVMDLSAVAIPYIQYNAIQYVSKCNVKQVVPDLASSMPRCRWGLYMKAPESKGVISSFLCFALFIETLVINHMGSIFSVYRAEKWLFSRITASLRNSKFQKVFKIHLPGPLVMFSVPKALLSNRWKDKNKAFLEEKFRKGQGMQIHVQKRG